MFTSNIDANDLFDVFGLHQNESELLPVPDPEPVPVATEPAPATEAPDTGDVVEYKMLAGNRLEIRFNKSHKIPAARKARICRHLIEIANLQFLD